MRAGRPAGSTTLSLSHRLRSHLPAVLSEPPASMYAKRHPPAAPPQHGDPQPREDQVWMGRRHAQCPETGLRAWLGRGGCAAAGLEGKSGLSCLALRWEEALWGTGRGHLGDKTGRTCQVGARQPGGEKGAPTTQVLGPTRAGFEVAQERTRGVGQVEAWAGGPQTMALNFIQRVSG